MPSSERYRQYAATCRRLACAHSGKKWTGKLIRLAYEYEAKAAEVEVGSRPMPDPPASPRTTRLAGKVASTSQG